MKIYLRKEPALWSEDPCESCIFYSWDGLSSICLSIGKLTCANTRWVLTDGRGTWDAVIHIKSVANEETVSACRICIFGESALCTKPSCLPICFNNKHHYECEVDMR